MAGIEYVCTGNNGRSPMAEAIARDYIVRNGLGDKLIISSSGTNHNPLFVKQRDDPQRQLALIELGLKNGVYSNAARLLAEEVVSGNDVEKCKVDRCIDYLVKLEEVFRDRALKEIGLSAEGNYHQPTTPTKGISLILAMNDSNVQQVTIISRELNIPCVVGTENATRMFQNGDLVEVDADKGVVRKIG